MDSAMDNLGGGLPAEVSKREAARIAGVDQKTIQKYIDHGMVRWRDPYPYSSRRSYKIELASLLALRTTYRTSRPAPPLAPSDKRTRRARVSVARRPLRHIKYWG